MKIFITALLEEETRKQIREAILGEARGIARSVLDQTVTVELKRIGATLHDRYAKNDWLMKGMVKEILTEVLNNNWDKIAIKFYERLDVAAEEVIAKKLKNKTVWEAKHQDEYIRKIVGKEIVRILALNLAKG